jgi:hypothetical protein
MSVKEKKPKRGRPASGRKIVDAAGHTGRPITIFLPDELFEELERFRGGFPLPPNRSQVIRQALEDYIRQGSEGGK